MALKTKINIDVQSKEFEHSFGLFQKYEEALKKMPDSWKQYEVRVQRASAYAHDMSAFLEEHTTSLNEAASAHGRFSDAAEKAGKQFGNLTRHTHQLSTHLASTAQNLFRRAITAGILEGSPGVVFALLGGLASVAGGPIGIGLGLAAYMSYKFYQTFENLAFGITDRRREALGLGQSYGSYQAFNANFARLGLGPEALGASAGGLYDWTSPQGLGLMVAGASGSNDPAEATIQSMIAVRKRLAGVPQGLWGSTLEGSGIGANLSLEQVVRAMNSQPGELEGLAKQFEIDKKRFALPDDVLEKLGKFTAQITGAGKEIESIFANKLVGLTDPLIHISEEVETIIETMSKNGTLNLIIDEVDDGLVWVTDKLESEEAKRFAKRFLKAWVAINSQMPSLMGWVQAFHGAGVGAADLLNYLAISGPKKLHDFIFGHDANEEVSPVPDSYIPSGSTHPHPSIRWGTGGIHLSKPDRASQAPLSKHFTEPSGTLFDLPSIIKRDTGHDYYPTPVPYKQPTYMPGGGTLQYPPVTPGAPGMSYPALGKQSMLDHLRGAKTPYAIEVRNETGGSAQVSTSRIMIAT